MALVVKDRVQEITTTAGTGTLTLGGAVLGFQTFAIIGDGNTTYYTIADPTTGDYEVGIGTYTSSGTTLSRTTVLESSNSGNLVVFAAGTKNVFCTYPAERAVYLSAAGLAVDVLDIGTLGTSTANITTANITSGTITTTPVNNTDIVNKEYADAIASGIHFHEAVGYATTAALPACTYNNGTSGVGATLTGNANGALTVDSYTFTSPADNGTRILIKNQATQADNGVYTLSQAGNSSPGAPFILTRATDFDTAGTGVDQIDEGDFFLVTSGTVNLNTAWVQQTAPPIVVGTTALVFQQFAAPITYTAGTGLSESPTYTFNIANTGTAGTYGGAASVPVFTTNAQGQVTGVTPTGIAIASGAVSGLAASATTDTTNASNISSGTLGTSRLSGSYTGVTGVGTLTAGTWNASTISAVRGGTGLTSYAVGDLVYADTTTSLAKLADVATGNALISGGVSAAPSYGKIGLATHVSGTLPIANGGTGSTSTQFVALGTNVSGTLPVGNGGTGLTTATGVLVGAGSSISAVAAGTTGNLLTSNGTTWTSAAPPTGMIYPGAGIPNSTGTSWATSYSTTGSGTVVALATNPSLVGATMAGTLFFNNATSPNTQTIQFGDNTGWSLRMMTSVTGTPTTRFTFVDNGNFTAVGSVTAANHIGPATGLTGTASININGTVGATTASTGAFTTLSATGVTTVQAGSAAAPAITTTGDTNTGIFFPAADTIAFSEGGAEAMRIDSSGNVGIGTSSPAAKLDIYTNQAAGFHYPIFLSANNSASAKRDYLQLGFSIQQGAAGSETGGFDLKALRNNTPVYLANYGGAAGAAAWRFYTEGTERLRITTTGGVSFGSSGTAYGTSGQVLTSAGNASPTWTTATSANTASAIVQRGASGEITVGDVTTNRPSAPTTGYIYWGNSGTRYMGFDGTNIVASQSPAFSITGNAATATTAAACTGNVSGTNTVNKSFQASNAVIGNATGGLNTLEIIGTSNAAMMTFHRPGAFAGYFGLDSDNVWKVGGWSYGAVSYPLLYSGSTTAPGGAPVYASRVWVNFNGATAGIRGSGNMSSITRHAAGDYTLNFATALTDTNYAVAGMSNWDGTNRGALMGINVLRTTATTSVPITTLQPSNYAAFDPTVITVQVLR
jgi:hypothetical protein